MSTFDLSLAIPQAPASDIKASTHYEKKYDPKQGIPVEQTITESGVTIDKSQAPALKIDGPVGNLYTQMLDRELSLESMSAFVAAAEEAGASTDISGAPTGKVSVTNTGAEVDTLGNDGYLYIADGGDQDSLRSVSEKMIKMRLSNPEGKLGLGLMSQGGLLANTENLMCIMESLNIPVVYTKHAMVNLAKSLVRK